jgi:hypothetical protein
MPAGAWVAIFGCLITVVLAVLAAVFWAGKVTAKLDILIHDSSEAKAEMKAFKENCFTKVEANQSIHLAADNQKTLWDKYDKLKKLTIKLMQKAGFDLSAEEI